MAFIFLSYFHGYNKNEIFADYLLGYLHGMFLNVNKSEFCGTQ
jgi:hypothetical protein